MYIFKKLSYLWSTFFLYYSLLKIEKKMIRPKQNKLVYELNRNLMFVIIIRL